jgi:hypothetical protein
MFEDCTRTGCAGGGGSFALLLGVPWLIGFPAMVLIGLSISGYLLKKMGLKTVPKVLLFPLGIATSFLLIKAWIKIGLFVFSL